MKKKTTKKMRQSQMTRREFVVGALAAGGVITGAPAFLRGQNLNNKLNIAMIACGGRALANMNGDGGGSGRGRGAAPGGDAPAATPSAPTGIPAENITVLCDVNQAAVDAAARRFPNAKKYTDFRRVFDSPNDFDAVMVSTCEHTHTIATYLALTHGKHVYCEKPLTHDIWEARLIRETAAKYPKLATQTGNQGHASPVRRQIKELIMAGAIGPVREVHVWAGRAWGLQGAESALKLDQPHGFYNGIQITDRFKEEMPIPPSIAWDLWLGPAPARPFHATYLPGPRWYRWWDFGNGTMSDLGGHDNDVVFQVLDIRQPLTVEAVSPMGKAHPELAPATMTVTYEFPARGSAPPVKLTWHQGESKPPQWHENKIPQNDRAQLFIGDKGMLFAGGGGALQLLPEEQFKGYQTPPETLPRSPGHWNEWILACKGLGPAPGSNFQYSGWCTESNHLGNVAYRTGKKIEWDYANLRARNAPEADKFIRRPYRKDWEGILKA
jgi:predicted dehydrogenase